MQALEALVAPVGRTTTVWIVSPPAGAKEIAHAAVLSASERATATASMRSSGPSCGQVAVEARGQLLDGVAHALLRGAPQGAALRARRDVGGARARP